MSIDDKMTPSPSGGLTTFFQKHWGNSPTSTVAIDVLADQLRCCNLRMLQDMLRHWHFHEKLEQAEFKFCAIFDLNHHKMTTAKPSEMQRRHPDGCIVLCSYCTCYNWYIPQAVSCLPLHVPISEVDSERRYPGITSKLNALYIDMTCTWTHHVHKLHT